MKKGVFVSLALILAVLLTAGCTSLKPPVDLGEFDPSVPQEQQCSLAIDIQVNMFDNEPVLWNNAIISIPEGTHSFTTSWVITYNNGYGYYTSSTKTGDITHEFIGGRKYRIYLKSTWLLFFTLYNPAVKELK